MDIDWAALGEVFVVGIGVTVALVVLFSFGITGLSARATAAAPDAADDGAARPGSSTGLAVAVLCFGVCALVVAYGLRLIMK